MYLTYSYVLILSENILEIVKKIKVDGGKTAAPATS